jgi:tyrosyl-tRNA synthetase
MYGRVLSIPDTALAGWYDLLLSEASLPAGLSARDAKRALARRLVDRFTGAGEGERAEAEFDRVFRAREAPSELEETTVDCPGGMAHLPQVIVAAFGGSRSDARRALSAGGVRLDGEALAPESSTCPAPGSTARCCRSAGAAFAGCAWRPDGRATLLPRSAGTARLGSTDRLSDSLQVRYTG